SNIRYSISGGTLGGAVTGTTNVTATAAGTASFTLDLTTPYNSALLRITEVRLQNQAVCAIATTASTTLTVYTLPTISGTAAVCVGNTTVLSGNFTPTSSTAWSVGNTGIATINFSTLDASTATVTGVSAGTTTVSYTDFNGCSNTTTVTVNGLPTITGSQCVLPGETVTYETTALGAGTWTVTNASVISSTSDAAGTFTVTFGSATGTTNIVYTAAGGCSNSILVAVGVAPTVSTMVQNMPACDMSMMGAEIKLTGLPDTLTQGASYVVSYQIGSLTATTLTASVTLSGANDGIGYFRTSMLDMTMDNGAILYFGGISNTTTGCSTSYGGSLTLTLLVKPTPEATLTSTTSPVICQGSSVSLVLTFNAMSYSSTYEPYIVTLSDGSIHTLSSGTSSYTLTLTPTAATTYAITNIVDTDNCSADPMDMVGTVTITTVNDRPTAAISGGGSICNGGTVSLTLTLTGKAPFNVVLSDGTSLFNLGIAGTTYTSTSAFTHVFPVTPSTTTAYAISSTTDANCTADASTDLSGNAVVNVTARPSVTLSGGTTLCATESSLLTFIYAGDASPTSWSMTYSSVGATSTSTTVTNITSGTYTVSVTPTATTVYSVTALSDNSGCAAISSDYSAATTSITVNARPTAVLSGTTNICTGSSAVLSVALTGVAPYDIAIDNYDGGNGISQPFTITSTASAVTFTVDPTVTTTYSILSFSDVNCSPLAGGVTGTAVVTVRDLPTAVLSGDATVCNGVSTDLTFSLTGLSPWTITYSETIGGSLTPTNYTITATTSTYTYSVSPSATTSYALVSVTDANGCSAINSGLTGSAVVTVKDTPTGSTAFTAGGSTSAICAGGGESITLTFTGLAPWDVTYSAGTATTTVTNILTNSYTFAVTPGSTTTYGISSLSDASGCSAISSDISSTAVLTVNELPQGSLTSQDACGISGLGKLMYTNTSAANGPFTVVYSFRGVQFTENNVTSGTLFDINSGIALDTGATASNIFTLVSVTSADNCERNSGFTASTTNILVDEPFTAEISGTTTIISSQRAYLNVTFDGDATPASVTITRTPSSGSPSDTTYTIDPLSMVGKVATLEVQPSLTTTYTIASFAGTASNSCTLAGTGSATVTVVEINYLGVTGAFVCPDATATFSVPATSIAGMSSSGTVSITYQWYADKNDGSGFLPIVPGSGIFNTTLFVGTNSNTLQINNVPSAYNNMQLFCLITANQRQAEDDQSISTDTVTLTLKTPISI
ncbi:MAG: beta strand repeat-containing protein, partial [Sphingomonadales bacterium]